MKTKRTTYRIDATDRPLGRLASEIAVILRGKNRPDFTPNIDAGDFVEIANIKKIKFTGKKFDQKKYYHYSGYPGGLKTKRLSELFRAKPQEVLKKAVYHMLPKNKLRNEIIKRLKVL